VALRAPRRVTAPHELALSERSRARLARWNEVFCVENCDRVVELMDQVCVGDSSSGNESPGGPARAGDGGGA
jgi:hypothetical protein